MPGHNSLSGSELHAPGYTQAGDPLAVGAGKQWIDSSAGTGKWALKIRKLDDSGWETVYNPGAVAITGGTIAGLTSFGVGAAPGTLVSRVVKEWASGDSTHIIAAFDVYGPDATRLNLRRANGTLASPTAVLSGEEIGSFQFRGFTNGGDFAATANARVVAVAEENFTPTTTGAKLQFTATPAGSIIQVTGMTLQGDKLTVAVSLAHTGSNLGLFGTTPTSKKTVSGSRGGNAALASLLTQLAAYGLITDSSSA